MSVTAASWGAAAPETLVGVRPPEASGPSGGSRGAEWGATPHDIRRSSPDDHEQPMQHQGCSQGPAGGLS